MGALILSSFRLPNPHHWTLRFYHLPLRRLSHPQRPLLPLHPLPLVQDRIARFVTMAAHLIR